MPGRGREGAEVTVLGLAHPYVGNLVDSPEPPAQLRTPLSLLRVTWLGQPELAGTLQPRWC